ncbi:hypothetical protein KM539_05680 [Xanthomonas translucens pv. poae]|uniref:hypothetical protein n=1 Tax=Xanthomonas graminis TaxID=3390026 RepID=UPI000ABA439C|nr:hypothetical protein [Xanthomonas translucens]UKE62970.1 hypothetical protein KM539_05680 [Xanthomonas translucens pv. poae]
MLATNVSEEEEASDNVDRQATMASLAGLHPAGAMPAAVIAPGCRSPGLPHDTGDAMDDSLAAQQHHDRA